MPPRLPADRNAVRALLLALGLVLLAGCAAYRGAAQPPVVLVVGDSVAAGYGLPAGQAFPAVLESLLARSGRPAIVLNAGVSGDTTSGGLARLPEYFPPNAPRRPDLLILELGANDAIQGRALAEVEADLDAMLTLALRHGTRVLLTGIGAGLRRHDAYRTAFTAIYQRLAARHGVALYPLIGEGVRGNPALVQQDGVHPNAEGARIIAGNLYPLVLELLPQPGN